MQSESPATIELHSEDKFSHDDVLKMMFEKVMKSEFIPNEGKLIREDADPGLCYLDKTADMGYLFLCFECEPVQF
mgnify:FL=1